MNRFKRILLHVMLVAIFALCALDVIAQSKSTVLFVAPNRVVIEDDQRIQTVVVSNKSDRPRRYDITVVNQKMNEQGMTQRVEDFEYAAKPMLRFVPKRFTLEAGERQVVRVMVRRPRDLGDGDYHSHMLFREVPLQRKTKEELMAERERAGGGVKFEIGTLYGVAVPVVVRQGNIVSSLEMTDVKVLNRNSLAASFKREGNAEASAYLTAKRGETDVIDRQWVRMYREVDQINKIIAIKMPKGEVLSPGDQINLELSQAVDGDMKNMQVIQTKTVSVQ